MSDLQIVTGLSILVSGFTQLRCSVSAYHWQVLAYLAWFSSLTHLCCLTFLRHYLYNHPGQRIWRLVSIFIIVVMLVVALIPTGYSNWLDLFYPYADPIPAGLLNPPPSSYAICFYASQTPVDPSSEAQNSYMPMIISTLFLILAFIIRVVRLHKTLSVEYIDRPRRFLSGLARMSLRGVCAWCYVHAYPHSLKRYLIYHPLLGLFLLLRVLLDVYTSMLMEVSLNTSTNSILPPLEFPAKHVIVR